MQRYTKEELHLTEEEFYRAVNGLFNPEAQELKLFVKGKEVWVFNKDKPWTEELSYTPIPVKGKKYLVYSSFHECWIIEVCDEYNTDKKCLVSGRSMYPVYYSADKPCPDVKVGDKVLVHEGYGYYYNAVVVSFRSDGTPVFYSDSRSSGFKQFSRDTWYRMD